MPNILKFGSDGLPSSTVVSQLTAEEKHVSKGKTFIGKNATGIMTGALPDGQEYIDLTLAASEWVNDTYTIYDSRITANSYQYITPVPYIDANKLTILQMANLQDYGQTAGSLTMKAYGQVPTEDLTVRLIFERGMELQVATGTLYPVGSIYMSVNNTNPGSYFGGTWVQIAQGRTIFGQGTLNGITYNAGTTVDAGLPNITGNVVRAYSDYNLNNGEYSTFVTNPFYYNESESFGTSQNLSSGSNDSVRNIKMDLSRSNTIFGNSTTVQPNAFVCYIWQRTA